MKMKRFKMMLVAVIAVFALMFGVKEAGAQSGLSDGVMTAPTGNFVSSAEADLLLTSQVAQLKNLLVTLAPGTQAYKNTERAIFYYSLIQGEIVSGKDIPLSIVTGLEYVAADSYTGATKTQLWSLRAESIDMLSF